MGTFAFVGFGILWVGLLWFAIGNVTVAIHHLNSGSRGERREARPYIVISIILLVFAYLIPSPTYASTETEIEARLNSTFQILLRELPKMENDESAKAFIRQHVLPITDTRTTARLMLGKNWRKATDSQKNRFTTAMTSRLIDTYAVILRDEQAQRAKFNIIRVTRKDSKKGSKFTVHATVTIDQKVDVAFTIIQRKGKDWKMIDVSIEGISLAVNWRSTFNDLIRRPGDLDKVITDLERGQLAAKE